MTRGAVLNQKTEPNAKKNGEGYRLPDSECPIDKYRDLHIKCLECPFEKCEQVGREKPGGLNETNNSFD